MDDCKGPGLLTESVGCAGVQVPLQRNPWNAVMTWPPRQAASSEQADSGCNESAICLADLAPSQPEVISHTSQVTRRELPMVATQRPQQELSVCESLQRWSAQTVSKWMHVQGAVVTAELTGVASNRKGSMH